MRDVKRRGRTRARRSAVRRERERERVGSCIAGGGWCEGGGGSFLRLGILWVGCDFGKD